jgi:hypothetical protein
MPENSQVSQWRLRADFEAQARDKQIRCVPI